MKNIYDLNPSQLGCTLDGDHVKKSVNHNFEDAFKESSELSSEQMAKKIILRGSYSAAVCASFGTPIDNFYVFQAIEQIMGHYIGKSYGYTMDNTTLEHLLIRSMGILGAGYLGHKAYQFIKVSNFFSDIPIVGEFIPSVIGRASAAFTVNYSIGKLIMLGYEVNRSGDDIFTYLKSSISEMSSFTGEAKNEFNNHFSNKKLSSKDLVDVFGQKLKVA